MKLEIGQRIKTNYSIGPFEITSIFRKCTCPLPLDSINNFHEAKESREHVHIVCHGEDRQESYFGWYNEETLLSVNGSSDRIILLPNTKPIQISLI